jgi:anti-anti-sigma factor
MKVNQREIGDVAVLELGGRFLGGPECEDLLARLDEIKNKDIVKVVFDLGEVSLLNSNGLAVLTAAQVSFQKAGGSVRLSGCHDRIKRVLEGAKVAELFQLFDSVNAAVDSFAE